MTEVKSVKGVIIACKGLGHWQVWVDTNETVDIFNTDFAIGDWLQIDKMLSKDGQLLVNVAKIPPVLKTVVNEGMVDLETVIVPLKQYLYTREAKKKNQVLASSLHVGNVCITAPNCLEHNRAYLVTVRSLIAGNNPLELYISKGYDAMWFVSRLVSRTPLTQEQVETLEQTITNGVVVPGNGKEKSVKIEKVGAATSHQPEPQSSTPLQSTSVPSNGTEKSLNSMEVGLESSQMPQSTKPLQPAPVPKHTLSTEGPAVGTTGRCMQGFGVKVVKRFGEGPSSDVLPSTKKPSLVNRDQEQVAAASDLEMRSISTTNGFTSNSSTCQPRAAASRPASKVSFSSASMAMNHNHNDMDVDRAPLANVSDVDAAVFKRPAPNDIVLPSNGNERSFDREESGQVTTHRQNPRSDGPMQPVPSPAHTLATESSAVGATMRRTSGFGLKFAKRFEKSPSSDTLSSTSTPVLVSPDQGQSAGGSGVDMSHISLTNSFAANESTHQLRAAASSPVSTASFSSIGRTPNHNDMDVDRPPIVGTTERRTSGFGLKFAKRLEKKPSSAVLSSTSKPVVVNPDQGQAPGDSTPPTNDVAANESVHQPRSVAPSPVSTASFSSAVTTQNRNDMDLGRPPLASVINDDAAVFKRPKTPMKRQIAPATRAIATNRPTSAVANKPLHQGLVVSATEKSFFLYSPDFINRKEPYCMKARNAHIKRGDFVTFTAREGNDDRIKAENLRKITQIFVVEPVNKTVYATVEVHVAEDYNLTERFVGDSFMPHIYDAKSLILQEHKGRRLRIRVKRGKFPKMPHATWGIVEVLKTL